MTPITNHTHSVLLRFSEAAGLTPRGLARSAGLSSAIVHRWGQGNPIRLCQLECVLDVLRLVPSQFLAAVEAEVEQRPLPAPVVERMVRPSKSWADSITHAVACLAAHEFSGGVLRYGSRWVALVPTDRGTVAVSEIQQPAPGLAPIAAMLGVAQ